MEEQASGKPPVVITKTEYVNPRSGKTETWWKASISIPGPGPKDDRPQYSTPFGDIAKGNSLYRCRACGYRMQAAFPVQYCFECRGFDIECIATEPPGPTAADPNIRAA